MISSATLNVVLTAMAVKFMQESKNFVGLQLFPLFLKVLALSEVEPMKHHIQDRLHQPLCPTNLKAQGDGHAPYVEADDAADILLTWTLRESSPRDFWSRWNDNPAPVKAKTILEFRTLEGEVRHTRTIAAGTASSSYSKENREAHFATGPIVFKVRAYAQENGLTSRYYNELTITVI